MTREEAKELLPIIQAFAEGRTIQLFGRDGWTDLYKDFIFDISYRYRIKPEPKYRPFKDVDECWQEMLKHQPFGWIKCRGCYFNIVAVTDVYAYLSVADGSAILLASKNSYNDNTFVDGAPFGVKEGVWEN